MAVFASQFSFALPEELPGEDFDALTPSLGDRAYSGALGPEMNKRSSESSGNVTSLLGR